MPIPPRARRPSAASRAVALGLACVLGACAGFQPQAGPGPEPDPPGRYQTLTEPVIAIGDTQEHESTSEPMVDNDNALDAVVDSTQRPAEQPLFGRRIMEWVFREHPASAFLHLGDVLDLSCQSEAIRMRRLFESGPPRGALLPGNHDGLMFGIYGYDVLGASRDEGAQKWNRACRRGAAGRLPSTAAGRAAFTKRDFIATYLDGLRADPRFNRGLPAALPEGDQRISWRNPDAGAYITAVESVLIDGPLFADSFIAQRLRLPPAPGAPRAVVLVALDTNQAGPLASTWDVMRGLSPGSMGHVRPEQVRAVRGWVAEAAAAGDIVVFAGHHNWLSLGLPSRLLLGELMSSLGHPLVYLSAHTHRGFWALHRTTGDRPLLELNTSSLSDWPIAYRRISFDYDEAAQRLRVRGDLMPAGERPHRSDADLLAAWERQACARSGVDRELLRRLDGELVAQQHASRGSLLALMRAHLLPRCDDCELDRYRRANAYQDQMLQLLNETGRHLASEAHRLDTVPLPAACGGRPWQACAASLMAEAPSDLAGLKALHERKADLVDLLGSHLDTLDEPRARAYMTCRAVLGARIDFDRSVDGASAERSEPHRRAEQFFRTEASVGMR